MECEFKNVSAQSLECPVCLNIFSEPKLLSCAHTFCKVCLERLMERRDDDQKLVCPVCREPTQIADVSKLQTNLSLKSLVEDVKNEYQGCTNCKSKEKPHAIVYCQECDKYLCTTCHTKHSQWEGFNDHKVLAISEIASGKMPVRKYRKCRKHPKEDEECFCYNCRMFVCFRCGMTEHAYEGHRIFEPSVYEKDLTKSVEELKSKADKKLASIKKYIDFIDEQKERVSNVRNQCIEDINKAYEESVRQLTEKKDHLVGEVKTRTDEVDADKIDKMKESAQHQISRVTTVTNLLASGKKIPLEMDALAAHDTLCQELQETLNQDDPDYKEVITSSKAGKRVAFERNLGTDELGLGRIVDSVGKDVALPTKNSMNAMVPTPDGRMALGCNGGRGIKIFSADGQLQQTVLKDVSLLGVGFLSDSRCVLLDCNNSIALYTAEYEKLNVKFETLNRFSGFGNLTVDSDDQIYVSYRKAEKIQVFSPAGGKALREIPCNGYEPEQIRTYNGIFIIITIGLIIQQ